MIIEQWIEKNVEGKVQDKFEPGFCLTRSISANQWNMTLDLENIDICEAPGRMTFPLPS
jgi:hypothetical protein